MDYEVLEGMGDDLAQFDVLLVEVSRSTTHRWAGVRVRSANLRVRVRR
jgi:hypothetical protein